MQSWGGRVRSWGGGPGAVVGGTGAVVGGRAGCGGWGSGRVQSWGGRPGSVVGGRVRSWGLGAVNKPSFYTAVVQRIQRVGNEWIQEGSGPDWRPRVRVDGPAPPTFTNPSAPSRIALGRFMLLISPGAHCLRGPPSHGRVAWRGLTSGTCLGFLIQSAHGRSTFPLHILFAYRKNRVQAAPATAQPRGPGQPHGGARGCHGTGQPAAR